NTPHLYSRDLHSFPTRRSSDLDFVKLAEAYGATGMRFEDKTTLVDDMKEALATDGPVLVDVRVTREENTYPMIPAGQPARNMVGDRKSTRLNSSHGSISYAVFC